MIRGIHVLAMCAIALSGVSVRATEFYTSRYQTLPVLDWVESRPPLAEATNAPAAADLARGLARALPLLTIRAESSEQPGFGPPAFVQRTVGGVRDAARIELGSPGPYDPSEVPIRARLDTIVFNRALRAAAWLDLMTNELDNKDPETGKLQARIAGPDETDGVWLVQPRQGGGVAVVLRLLRRRGPRRIVYLGTGRIAQVFPRNGVNLFLERECSDFGGYFEQMWNVHFPAGTRGTLDLTPRHHLVDVDFGVHSTRLPTTAIVWREIRFLVWLLPFLTRCQASIVTATNPYVQGLNAALASRLLGIPYAVIITRDYDWDWAVLGKQAFRSVYPSRMIERAIGRWVLRQANLVLADRAYYRQFAVRNGTPAARAVATRVLADSAYASAEASAEVRARYGLGSGPLLSYVGRLDADKFALDLVECLGQVHARFPEVVLACAGTGALADELRRRACELGVGGQLRLLGAVDLADLPALVASSNVFVAPHMGYTLIEAGLTGVPIVTYAYDFHAEIVSDGETGYLVPFRDVAALAARVCELLADPALARAIGANLRTRLLRDHSLAAVIPLYRGAYDQVLGSAA
ncbi:MAG: glycosyltransferase family 4 protein [Chloroflexi bacterium]|nr:glycosyltransferase family 4 protein [Chloroflexota bacterium]